jgi:hypothetical protein
MACDRMRELAWLEVDGELTEAERAGLAAHVEQCADCRAAQAAAARVVDGVRRLAPPPVPLGFGERTIKRLEESGAPRRRRPLPWIVPIALAAATIVAAAVFVVERRHAAPAAGSEVAFESREASVQQRARDAGQAPGFAGEAPGLKPSAKAPEGEVRRWSDESRIHELDDGTRDLLALLAQGEPADALERLSAAPVGGRLEEPLDRIRVAEEKVEKVEEERGKAKDGERAAQSSELPAAAPAPAPALRFLRIKGDPKKVDEILAEESQARRTTRDDAGRGVVDLDEKGMKPLRERLAAAGLVCEELTAQEWLRAARAAVANEQLAQNELTGKAGVEKRSAAPKEQSLPESDRGDLEKSGALKKADATKEEARKGQAKNAAPTAGKAGAAAPAAPAPRRVERLFLLLDR